MHAQTRFRGARADQVQRNKHQVVEFVGLRAVIMGGMCDYFSCDHLQTNVLVWHMHPGLRHACSYVTLVVYDTTLVVYDTTVLPLAQRTVLPLTATHAVFRTLFPFQLEVYFPCLKFTFPCSLLSVL